MPTCPRCHQFLAKVTAYFRGDEIERVTGICKRHGEVEPNDWDADMFDTEGR